MKQVKIIGTGQLNGPISVNKTILLDDSIANRLQGNDEAKLALLAVHFPGVKFNPRRVSFSVSQYREPKLKTTKPKQKVKTEKKPLSLGRIISFILLLPFKLVWWVLKFLWNSK
ncbi:hypothetical protein ACR78Z_24350 [Sphingobacterium thalpophilum]|uniref:hypothetical protein n=1 Tax=Sphingobacterium thalpophilum TaxID=259 RepID=UPI003DA65B79